MKARSCLFFFCASAQRRLATSTSAHLPPRGSSASLKDLTVDAINPALIAHKMEYTTIPIASGPWGNAGCISSRFRGEEFRGLEVLGFGVLGFPGFGVAVRAYGQPNSL